MELASDQQVANTRVKLARLETRFEVLRNETGGNQRVRELSMRSLKRLINQFKEEIALYECRRASQAGNDHHRAVPRGIQSHAELENTRRKLHRLEEILESKNDYHSDDELGRAERTSLKRKINQLKEEIARYEAHQPAK